MQFLKTLRKQVIYFLGRIRGLFFQANKRTNKYNTNIAYRFMLEANYISIRLGYSVGMLIAIIQHIKSYGKSRPMVAIEFGVCQGGGLLELEALARLAKKLYGLDVKLLGFDNGIGLPPDQGNYDHKELFSTGEFSSVSTEVVGKKIDPSLSVIYWGDVSETMHKLGQRTDGGIIGFVSVDVDFYSSTAAILEAFGTLDAEFMVCDPVFYFDDVESLWAFNDIMGGQKAIREFNDKFGATRFVGPKLIKHNLYSLALLDHPFRTGESAPKEYLNIPLQFFQRF